MNQQIINIVKQIKVLLDLLLKLIGPTQQQQSSKNSYINPLDKMVITSPFGPRIDPVTHKQHVHTGVDLAERQGVDVKAVADGEVLLSAMGTNSNHNNGYGNTIFITHKGYTEGNIDSIYHHLSKLLVKKGDKVKQGQVIGKVGSTGMSTGPHLDFHIRRDNVDIDPIEFLKENK